MNLRDCPKWSKCSAPICPLDGNWHLRKMLRNDPACFYFLEHAKVGSKVRFEERGLTALYESIDGRLPSFTERWGRLRRFYERAKTSGARLNKSFNRVKGEEHVET